MKRKYFYLFMQFLLICGLNVNAASAQDSNISLSDIIQNVQKKINFLSEHIANFVTIEEITIKEFDNKGNVKKTKSIISEYRVIPEKLTYVQSSEITQEIREILSVKEEGIKNVNKFIEPVSARGNPYNDLFLWFDNDSEKCFDYKLNGTEKINERDAYVIYISIK